MGCALHGIEALAGEEGPMYGAYMEQSMPPSRFQGKGGVQVAKNEKRWVFDPERCKGCRLCIDACPENILRSSDRTNRSGYRTVEITGQDRCISCGFCALMCPDVAIEVFRPERRRDEEDGRDQT